MAERAFADVDVEIGFYLSALECVDFDVTKGRMRGRTLKHCP